MLSLGGSYQVAEQTVEKMCAQIIHRGPDSQGIYSDERLAFGMRRLSIIDLEGGAQPIFNEDHSIAVIQNGEIYNYQELRKELVANGHEFRTDSDTEVIVHLYEEYGDRFVEHLNGMFAIAIWDSRKKRLVIARDRLGQKPLFYSSGNGLFAFGSELKCLKVLPEIDRTVDGQALFNYLTLGYINQPRTIYSAVKKLPPGCILTVEDGQVALSPYWRLPSWENTSVSFDEASNELRALIADATRIRMISDVPIGAFLSGGLDSSIVVSQMAQQSSNPIKTFFIDFAEEAYSEKEFARDVAARYQTDHHELRIEPNAVDLIGEVVHYFDEPFADSSAIPTYLVSKITKSHVTVALAGDGGDESFGGYSRYKRILKRKNAKWLRKGMLPVSLAARSLPGRFPGKRLLQSLATENLPHFATGVQELESKRILSSDFSRSLSPCVPSENLNELRRIGGGDPLAPYAHFDLSWYLPGDILSKVDRMSMAHSLEVRSPFLDYRVVELAATYPWNWKINNGQTKYILRHAFESQLPESVLKPRKRGFSVPMGKWLREELRPMVDELASDRRMAECGYFSMGAVRSLLDEHMSGARNRGSQIWRLLILSEWLKNN